FLLQIYCPADDVQPQAFHRMLHLFCCPTPGCLHAACVRAQLPEGAYHAAEDLDVRREAEKTLPRGYGHDDLCGVCGLKTDGQRCPVQEMYFCCRAHQKDYMKNITKRIMADKKEAPLAGMFEEMQMEVFADEGSDEEEDEAEKERREVEKMEELNKSLDKTKLEGLPDGDDDDDDDVLDDELEQKGGSGVSDPVTANFLEQIKKCEDQVLRYSRWSTDALIWSSGGNQPGDIPPCENCGSERIFEFEITPQILSYLKVELPSKLPSKTGFFNSNVGKTTDIDGASVTKVAPGSVDGGDAPPASANPLNKVRSKLDFGCIAVYTCSMSCELADNKNAKEYVFAQPPLDEVL
ncbi:hypothetical protein TeGR_g12225, partial [Tetraparma gracilis]